VKLRQMFLSLALVAGAAGLAGCELIVGIKDGRPIGSGGDEGDGGGGGGDNGGELDAGVDLERDAAPPVLPMACDPVKQDCPGADACYLDEAVQSFCSMVPAGAAGRVQDSPCLAAADQCLVNGCDKGHIPFLIDQFSSEVHCAFLCSPIDTHQGSQDGAAGVGVSCLSSFGGDRPDGPGEDYQCRYLQSFYPGLEFVPASLGMCVSRFDWGDCRECDITDQATFSDCSPGCVSVATAGQIPGGADPSP
jgi:hypothetical protein